MKLRFARREVRDLLVAWVALGVAFTVFLNPDIARAIVRTPERIDVDLLVLLFGVSLATAGVGFLLHELAHKVVAVRFGQVAGFRADYGMLLVTVLSAFLGFLFAAPGAVYHRGRITRRQSGLIALAGPLTNLVLAGAFLGLFFAIGAGGNSLLAIVASRGLFINLLLAGFNMIPFGPLDGRTVFEWNKAVFVAAFAVTAVPAAAVLFGFVP